MPSFYEWVLTTPAKKEFASNDADGAAFGHADVVRLVSAKNDHVNRRFFVRFIYGRDDAGSFIPALRDDGIVIGGPNYEALLLDPDGSIDEPDLLQMCADILGWDGSMRLVE